VRAAIFHAPGDVRIEEVEQPDPAPGEVLIRVDASLTCATDAKAYRRGHPVLLGPAPARFGHEYAGTVIAAGAGARFSPGDRVAGANSAPCDRCEACLRGQEPLCENLFPLLNGAYAEQLLIPERIAAINLHHLPDGVAPELGALCEPLACALHGVEASDAQAGETVAVLGRGALGLLLAAALAARGCAVTALTSSDPDPHGRFDRVIEAAGSAEAWTRAVGLVRAGGTVVLFGGLPAGTAVAFDAYRLHYEAITLRGVFHHAPRHVRAAIDLVTRDPAPYRALLTHAYTLDEVVVPLEMTAGIRPRAGILKAVIRA
jgi:L-iditol 2-dehydrogenase